MHRTRFLWNLIRSRFVQHFRNPDAWFFQCINPFFDYNYFAVQLHNIRHFYFQCTKDAWKYIWSESHAHWITRRVWRSAVRSTGRLRFRFEGALRFRGVALSESYEMLKPSPGVIFSLRRSAGASHRVAERFNVTTRPWGFFAGVSYSS